MAENNQTTGQGFLKDLGAGLTNWTEKWIPDSLVIVFILSIIAYVLALIWGFGKEVNFGSRLYGGVEAWGKGFWIYLKFAMQMCLIMMTGYILALSPPVRRLLDGLAGLPNQDKPAQAIVVMALFSPSRPGSPGDSPSSGAPSWPSLSSGEIQRLTTGFWWLRPI